MTSQTPTVFVVDDDLSVREALSSLIRSVALNVETFASAREFLQHPPPSGPTCLILDVRMPGLGGLDLQHELAKTGIQVPIIFLTGHGDIPMAVRAMKAGAIEFLSKPVRDEDLLDAIRQALAQDAVSRKERARVEEIRERYNTLTPREREVMARIVKGALNKQVAIELGIAEITIKVHRHNIMRKMQARSLVELSKMFDRLDLPAE